MLAGIHSVNSSPDVSSPQQQIDEQQQNTGEIPVDDTASPSPSEMLPNTELFFLRAEHQRRIELEKLVVCIMGNA